MKVKDLIEMLKMYNPEYEVAIALPPGWYKEDEANDEELWEKEGWTIDSIDYTLFSDENKLVSICPIAAPKKLRETGKCVLS